MNEVNNISHAHTNISAERHFAKLPEALEPVTGACHKESCHFMSAPKAAEAADLLFWSLSEASTNPPLNSLDIKYLAVVAHCDEYIDFRLAQEYLYIAAPSFLGVKLSIFALIRDLGGQSSSGVGC